ncbi:MAG: HEPN domain-containing protein [Candidatus Caldarchaeales archaeon]
MSHLNEIRILRRRAKGFLEKAVDSLNSGDYDLAAFLSEQSVQLHLKSILLEKIGEYPRTHSISTVLSILMRVPNCSNLVKLLEEKKIELRLMEDAYIVARYLVEEYSKEEAEILVDLARQVLKYGEIC